MILRAPAKLTTSLRVTGVRDDGFHLIDAEMVSVSMFDTLRVIDSDSTAVTVEGADVDDSLVAAALRLVGRTATVVVDKTIPPGAGLGGGSTDAGAILRWAEFGDLAAAARIGADVAFCSVGGRARVRGIGEIVEPLAHQARTFTLLVSPVHCSTPAVYRKWDELGAPTGDNGNDLEPAALAVEPDLARYRDNLGDVTGETPRLAGSGSTWFVEGRYDGEGLTVVETVPAEFVS